MSQFLTLQPAPENRSFCAGADITQLRNRGLVALAEPTPP
jgi:hypothetical protein